MRWLLPKSDEKRITKKFAWFPVQVQNEKVWLESYYLKEYYIGPSEGWIYTNSTKAKSRFLTLRGAGGEE